ncbi:MAG: FMN-binding glutamate synthase family protein, partial [Alphaproteobacteria bacterium]|nr:FMN-binding glutamate synthase family protein [Alphaproteobacteria bacterium]
MMNMNLVLSIIQIMTTIFILAIGLAVITIVVLYILDVTQTKHAVRRNFPVIGRMRYLFEHLGEFFRQYFFALDREEMPFNRAERSYVYRAAKGVDATLAFGSTRDLRPPGTVLFANAAYPPLDQDAAETAPMEIGPYARQPYLAGSLFNISGMSFGAISRPAALALSHGAQKAGVWLNTGEGGLSPYHLDGGCDVVFQIGTAKYGVRDAAGHLSDDKLRE